MPVIITSATTHQRVPTSEIPDVLANAAANQTSVTIRATSDTRDREVAGTILRRDGSALIVTLSDDPLPTATTASVYSAVMWIDGVQYAFDTTGASLQSEGEPVLRLQEPAQIDIVERRRASRRPLRAPSRVRLQLADPKRDKPFIAVMMNVSPHGLACRLDAFLAKQLSVGAGLTSFFSLEPNDQTFAFPGRIVNITQGGTPGQAIVGIEFTGDKISKAQEEALSAALTRGMNASS